jgi:tetratricopeptide (TPR) repeat protein
MKSKILNLIPCVVACLVAALLAFGFIAGDKIMPITTKSDNARTLFLEAWIESFESGDMEKVTGLLTQALKLDQDFALANLWHGFIGFGSIDRIKYLNAANEQIDKVSEAEKHFIQAFLNLDNGKRDESFKELKHAISLAPDDKLLTLQLAYLYANYGKYEEALEYAKRSIEIDPDFTGALNYQGFLLWNLKKYDEAEILYLKSLEMSPSNTQFLNRYGQLLRAVDRNDEAIKMHKKALSIKEDYLSALFLGHSYVAADNYPAAREAYLKAREVSANNNQKNFCLFSVATTWLYDGNLPEALAAFDRQMEFNKQMGGRDESIIGITINKAYSSLLYEDYTTYGKLLEEYRNYLTSLNLSEPDRIFFGQYANLFEGYLYAYSGKTELAEKFLSLYEKSLTDVEKDTYKSDLFEMKGLIDYHKGNYREAITNLEQAGAMALYYAGLAYEKRGDIEKAKEIYSKISNNKLTSFDLAATKPFARKRLAQL